MASDKLVISLLGPPEIKVGGKILHIRRRMFRYFIFYLACQKIPVSRESLCELFWPEKDETTSRKNLREVISKIRSDLPVDDLILTEKEYVSFNQEKINVDVRKFEEAIALLRKNLDQVSIRRLTDQVYRSIQESLNLWREERFLGGVSTSGSDQFQLWVLNTAENLQYWRQMMIEWLADRCIVVGDLAEAITWLSMARTNDPGNIEIDLLLLTCLRDLGLWSRALEFCELLEKEFPSGGEKSIPPSLVELISHVRQDAFDNYAPRPLTSVSEKNNRKLFVGRRDQLNALDSLLNRGGFLLLKGDTGSGKTALLKEFFEHIDILPFSLFHEAKPGDQAKPFSGVIEGVRKLVPPESWEDIDPADREILEALFSAVNDFRVDQAVSTGAINEQRLIAKAFSDLVAKANRKKRGLLIIDNAQWLDEQSLDTIIYMYDHMAPQKTSAIIFSFRDDMPDSEVEKNLIKKFSHRSYEIMSVDLFAKEEVAEIFFREFGKECSAELTGQLQKLSGGNSRILQTLLDTIKQKNLVEDDQILNPKDLINPETIRVIIEILEPISDEARSILKSLAILNEPFGPMMIEKMTGLTGHTLLEKIRALEKRRIIYWSDNEDGVFRYWFTHGIVAEYLANTIDPMEKRLLHLKAAEMITESEGNGDPQAAHLAWHFQEAGQYSEALKYWIAAGTFEKEKLSRNEAYKFYQNAVTLVKRLGNKAGSDEIYRLVNDWGDLALQTDDLATFANLNSICLRAGETRNDLRLIGFGKSGLGWVAHSRGYIDLAENFLIQAIDIFKMIDDKISLMDAYFRLGTIYFVQQNYIKVIAQYNEVLKIALTMQSSKAMSFYKKAAAFLAFANCITGHLDNARFIIDQGAIISQSLGEENYSIQLRAAEAISHYYAGDLKVAQEKIEAVLPMVFSFKLDWWATTLLTTLGQAAMEEGNLTICWKAGETITGIKSLMINSGWGQCYRRYLRGELLLNLGDLENAEENYRSNLENPPDKFLYWISKLGVAKVEMQQRKFKSCKQILDTLIRDTTDNGFELISQGIKAEMIRLTLIQRDSQTFVRAFNHYGPSIKQSEYKGIKILAAVLEGQGFLLQGKNRDAKTQLTHAMEAAREDNYFWIQLDALRSLIEAGENPEENRKEARRIIKKAEFNCEISELKNGLEKLKKQWYSE